MTTPFTPACSLLHEAIERGITVSLVDDSLYVSGPFGTEGYAVRLFQDPRTRQYLADGCPCGAPFLTQAERAALDQLRVRLIANGILSSP
jgi:hypothetical protein